jgi:hypothetical protein
VKTRTVIVLFSPQCQDQQGLGKSAEEDEHVAVLPGKNGKHFLMIFVPACHGPAFKSSC